WLLQDEKPGRMGRASTFLAQRSQGGGQPGADFFARHLLRGSTEEYERADFARVVHGDDGVLHDRIGGGDELHTYQPDVHPGAGRELEVLDHAAVEYDSLR